LRRVVAGRAGAVKAATRTAPPAPGDDQVLRLNTELISLTVTVTDKQGRALTGLDKAAFSVFEDGIAQEISFFSHCDAPVSVAIVFDTSGSVDEQKIAQAREALAAFIQASHPEDEYSLVIPIPPDLGEILKKLPRKSR
jgi:Ca-activated chloride channel homolog